MTEGTNGRLNAVTLFLAVCRQNRLNPRQVLGRLHQAESYDLDDLIDVIRFAMDAGAAVEAERSHRGVRSSEATREPTADQPVQAAPRWRVASARSAM